MAACFCHTVLQRMKELSYLDLSFGLLKSVLVGDALELVTLVHQLGILLFDLALAVHDLRDLFRHHFCHLFAHIVLQFVKKL